MTNYRIFLLSFLTVSWFFLTGFNQAANNDVLTEETQKTERELINIETQNNSRKLPETKQENAKGSVKPVKANSQKAQQTTIKTTDSPGADGDRSIKSNELEKPLDLSLPYKDSENTELKTEQKPAAQSGETNIFVPETKKKARSLELDGDLLMSPEPEAGKLKSVDGAGIVIKLKR